MHDLLRQPQPSLRYRCPACNTDLGTAEDAAPRVDCPACATRCALGDARADGSGVVTAVKVVPTGTAAIMWSD